MDEMSAIEQSRLITFLHAVDEEFGIGGEVEGGVPLGVPAAQPFN